MKSKFLRIGKGSLSVVLSIMMILSTMILGVGTVGTIDASAETDPELVAGNCRIYFPNSSNWSTVNVHIWKDRGADYTKWPGNVMLESKEYEGVYYIDFPNTYDRLIFNSNGTAQTDTIIFDSINNNEQIWASGKWMTLDEYLYGSYYVVGCFRSKDANGNFIYTGTFDGDWNDNSTNLKFERVEGSLFKFDTRCTLAELSRKATADPQYFTIKSSSGDIYYNPTTSSLKDADESKEITLRKNASLNYSLYFDSSSTEGTVILYFDSSNGKFWYELEGLETFENNVSHSGNGSVSVDKESASAGKKVTVNVSPEEGYVVDTVTATGADGSVITLTKVDANTYTYTMPKQSVNINVAFREAQTFTVNAKVASGQESLGTVTSSHESITEGGIVTLTANPKSGYNVKWTINGDYEEIGSTDLTSRSVTITPKSNITAYASFTEDPGTVASDKFLLYSTNQNIWEPDGFLPVYKKTDGSYYAVFDSEMLKKSKSYYFALSGSQDASRMYWQGESYKGISAPSTDTNYVTSTPQDYNVGSTRYNYTQFSLKSGNADAVVSVKVAMTADVSGNVLSDGYSVVPEIDPDAPLKVNVIAKDGTLRNNPGYEKFPQKADTTVKYSDGTYLETSREYSNRATSARVIKGSEITITTTVNSTYKDTYYVKAFCINGLSYGITSKDEALSKNGVYTCTYEIPEDAEGTIEITPIYFYFDDSNAITFYVEHFEGAVKETWGNTISCHVYYSGGHEEGTYGENQNAFGGYPGQPMVYEGGRYYVQVPRYLNNDTTKPVRGITLNNYYWDDVHGEVILGGDKQSDTDNLIKNCQTYDYDDFRFLTEKTDNIVFRFKYRTKQNPNTSGNALAGNTPESKSTLGNLDDYKNSWESLKNYVDEDIDVFGHVLSEEQKKGAKVHIVSNGYEVNYLGDYATEWYIYDENGNFVANLPPSVLLYEVETGSVLNESIVPADFEHGTNFWKAFVKLYNAGFTGKPADITYETAIASKGNTNGGAKENPGYRCDGRWYYIEPGKTIHANILIEYSDNNGVSYTRDNFVDGGNKGETTGASAFFTNPEEYFGQTETGDVQSAIGEYFEVEANRFGTGSEYYFVGWYLYQDGVYTPLDSTAGTHDPIITGKTEMITNVTLVARYKKYTSDDLRISHRIYADATKYEDSPEAHGGDGTPYVKVQIVDSVGNVVETINNVADNYAAINKTKLDYYREEGDYKIVVTLTTEPDEGDVLDTVYRQEDKTYIEYDKEDNTEWSNGGEITDNTLVYTCSISDLFDGDKLKTNHIPFYSDLIPGKVSVDFKYYDRAKVDGIPAIISEEPTTVTVEQKFVTSDNKPNIDGTVAAALGAENESGKTVTDLVDTVIDDYIFWVSQSEAENGIQEQVDYHGGSAPDYAKYSKTSYHTDCYGNVQTTGEKWVTYYAVSGKELTDAEIQNDPYLVSKITVWGYNTPKKYTVTIYSPGEEDISFTDNGNGVYFADNVVPNSAQSFYNVRVGGEGYDNEEEADALNSYLQKRGIEIPYVGEKVSAPRTVVSGETTYIFDGWYQNGVKLSSDRSYANRITSDLTITAGYVQDGSESTIGASVTKNPTDRYVDENGVERVRFNTQLNVYGCEDSDENIKGVAAIYIQLPKDVEWNEENLAQINFESIRDEIKQTLTDSTSHSGTCVVDINEVQTDASGKVIYYSYDVVWGEDTEDLESYEIALSNKNRVQFTLTMKADLCDENGANSAILAFAAINYNGEWIVSDNYVSYIKGE